MFIINWKFTKNKSTNLNKNKLSSMQEQIKDEGLIDSYRILLKNKLGQYIFHALTNDNNKLDLINTDVVKTKTVFFQGCQNKSLTSNNKTALNLENFEILKNKIEKSIAIRVNNLGFMVNHLVGITSFFEVQELIIKTLVDTKEVLILLNKTSLKNCVFGQFIENEEMLLGDISCNYNSEIRGSIFEDLFISCCSTFGIEYAEPDDIKKNIQSSIVDFYKNNTYSEISFNSNNIIQAKK